MHKDVLEFVIKDLFFSTTLLSTRDELVTLLEEKPQCLYVDISRRWGMQASVAWAVTLWHIVQSMQSCTSMVSVFTTPWTCGHAAAFEAQVSIQCLLIEAHHLWSMLPTKT
jgi:hypothetical protein